MRGGGQEEPNQTWTGKRRNFQTIAAIWEHINELMLILISPIDCYEHASHDVCIFKDMQVWYPCVYSYKSHNFAKLQKQLLDRQRLLSKQATSGMGEQKLNITWSEFAGSCGRSFARLLKIGTVLKNVQNLNMQPLFVKLFHSLLISHNKGYGERRL